jgi:hypothetical protein
MFICYSGLRVFMLTHSYFAVKSKDKFDSAQEAAVEDKVLNRKVSKIKKKLKPHAKPSRNVSWFKMELQAGGDQKDIQEFCGERICRIIVLSGELFRLGDRHQTKYRIYADEKNQFPISKEIPNAEKFFEYFEKNIFPTWNKVNRHFNYNPIFEGMGRSFLRKFFYYDHDFHTDNALMGKDNYFYAIDHDWCFVNVTGNMHVTSGFKTTFTDEKGINQVRHIPREYNDIFHVEDYDNLPLIQHRNMGAWFCDAKNAEAFYYYAKAFYNSSQFLNEKHFSTIFFLVTQDFQKYLVNYHIEHNEDKKNLLLELEKVFTKMPEILKQSSAFLDYLRENRMAAMQAVLFELYDFFIENRHYLPQRNKEKHETVKDWMARTQLASFILDKVNEVINRYSDVLVQLGERQLDVIERSYLTEFARDTCKLSLSKLDIVKNFYEKQEMTFFAKAAKSYMSISPETKTILKKSPL